MKRIVCAWPSGLLATLLCLFHAAPAGAGDKYVSSSNRTSSGGTVSITIESISVPNGPARLSTSACPSPITIPVSIPAQSSPVNTAMLIRNTVAPVALAHGYDNVVIGACPTAVVFSRAAGDFCLEATDYAGGPNPSVIAGLPTPCGVAPYIVPMTGPWGLAFAAFLLLGGGVALLSRRGVPVRAKS